MNPKFWIFKFWLQNRNQWPRKPEERSFRNPPFWISHFRPWNCNQRPQKPPYIHFRAIWTKNVEFSQKQPPYWIHHSEFSNFDCRILFSDLENLIRKHFFIYKLYIKNFTISETCSIYNKKIKKGRGGSKFWTTECRTTDISEFRNFEY